MGWWSKSNDKEILLESLLKRCEDIRKQAEKGIKEYGSAEKNWT